jgi:hypothetical protein
MQETIFLYSLNKYDRFSTVFPLRIAYRSKITSEYIYFVYHNYEIMHQITIFKELF